MKIITVCGTFDEDGGKFSKVGDHIHNGLDSYFNGEHAVQTFNGGPIESLPALINLTKTADAVLWLPNISNDVETKFVGEIKKGNYKCTLIISKRNDDDKYTLADLTQRALAVKANLFLEIKKEDRIKARLIDPLGNLFLDWTEDFVFVGEKIGRRIRELRSFTRMGSVQGVPFVEVPDEQEFFSLIKEAGKKFHNLVPSVANPSRFLGNASFRCTQGGFPSFRGSNGFIYVSQRNVDKKVIDRNGFVAVSPTFTGVDVKQVVYYGNRKPSVDAPSQIRLFNYYPKVNYILHGHVYLHGFSYTSMVIPCGATEEADEIIRLKESNGYTFFGLNLLGHGFIVLSDDVEKIEKTIKHCKSRNLPEKV